MVPKNELITEDNVLYFASSGRQGYGAYDIFKINISTAEAAINLGKPVNSEKDDFSFSFNKLQDVGYFSSNRSGLDAIYTVLPICKANSLITVNDKKSGKMIANALVIISDTNGNILSSVATNADGKVKFDLQCNTEYLLKISASNYEEKKATISKIQDFYLNLIEKTLITRVLYQAGRSIPCSFIRASL